MALIRPDYYRTGGAGGSITVTGGAGGYDPYAPRVRPLLARRLAEWDDYNMVPTGVYNEYGDEEYRRKYTPLGKELRRFRKATIGCVTVLDMVATAGGANLPHLSAHLSSFGLSFGMTREAALAVADAEEKALAERKATDTERQREQENTAAVLAILRLPWTHAERKRGREVERENVTDHLLSKLPVEGYVFVGDALGIGKYGIRVWRREDAPERML